MSGKIVTEMNIDEFDFNMLERDERILAKVLLKNNLLSKESFEKYLDFKRVHNEEGKSFLGEILVNNGFCTKDDIDAFMEEQEEPYMEFCEKLASDGFLEEKQYHKIRELHDSKTKPVLSLIHEMNIMTRDNFVKMHANNMGGLKLGEWLVFNKRTTKEQIEEARKLQRINSLQDYLIHHQLIKEAVLVKVLDKISSVF